MRAHRVARQLLSPSRGETSSVLARARAFLPALEAANRELAGKDPAALDMEQQLAPGSTHIQLDLSCGVLELRDGAAQTAAAQAAGFSVCTRPKKKVKRRQ